MTTATPTPTGRKFTVEQANAMLPLLKRIAKDVHETWKRISHNKHLVDRAEKLGLAQDEALLETVKRDIDRINQYIREIESLGGSVDRFNRCRVLLPTTHRERVVYLVWELGEDRFGHWRDQFAHTESLQPIIYK